jgi:hypothetical protein
MTDAANPATTKRRLRRRHVVITALIVAAVLFVPLPVRDADKAYVVTRDVLRLRDVKPVFLDWRYQPFYDSALIARSNPTWHLQDDLDLDLGGLEAAGFRPANGQRLDSLYSEKWFMAGNVGVEITDTGSSGLNRSASRGLRLHVYHGWLGAQGYRVRIYRCLLGTFAWYSMEWVS